MKSDAHLCSILNGFGVSFFTRIIFHRPRSMPMLMSLANFAFCLVSFTLFVCLCRIFSIYIYYSSVKYFAFTTSQLLYWVNNFLNDVVFWFFIFVWVGFMRKHERTFGVCVIREQSKSRRKKTSNAVCEKRDNGLVAFSTHSDGAKKIIVHILKHSHT